MRRSIQREARRVVLLSKYFDGCRNNNVSSLYFFSDVVRETHGRRNADPVFDYGSKKGSSYLSDEDEQHGIVGL